MLAYGRTTLTIQLGKGRTIPVTVDYYYERMGWLWWKLERWEVLQVSLSRAAIESAPWLDSDQVAWLMSYARAIVEHGYGRTNTEF